MKTNVSGVGVALVTPFDRNGGVDYDALGRLVDYMVDNGVGYLVALGTTAETPTLTSEEKSGVLKCVKERNAGRLPLIVGVGGNNTAEVIAAIKKTDLEGVTAVLSVTPYYNKPSQEGLYQHYKAIAEASPLPILLYNVPSRTGVNMTATTSLRLAHEVKNIMGIKEACGSISQMSYLLAGRPEGFLVLSGDDSMAVPLVAIGGDGIISVAANAFPKAFTELMVAAGKGDIPTTAAIYRRLFEAMEALFEEGNPVGVKAALAVKGMMSKDVRLPLVGATDHLYNKMKGLIERNKI